MTKPYTPRPGSLSDKVIALCTNIGPISCNQITERFGVPSNNIFNGLKPAVKNGALERVRIDGSAGYALCVGQPAPAQSTATATASAPVQPQPKAKKTRAARADIATELQPTPNPAIQLTLTRWSDGDVFVQDFEVCEGGQLRLTLAQQQQMVDFLCAPAVVCSHRYPF